MKNNESMPIPIERGKEIQFIEIREGIKRQLDKIVSLYILFIKESQLFKIKNSTFLMLR